MCLQIDPTGTIHLTLCYRHNYGKPLRAIIFKHAIKQYVYTLFMRMKSVNCLPLLIRLSKATCHSPSEINSDGKHNCGASQSPAHHARLKPMGHITRPALDSVVTSLSSFHKPALTDSYQLGVLPACEQQGSLNNPTVPRKRGKSQGEARGKGMEEK